MEIAGLRDVWKTEEISPRVLVGTLKDAKEIQCTRHHSLVTMHVVTANTRMYGFPIIYRLKVLGTCCITLKPNWYSNGNGENLIT
jgi:hypothetical protein